jgi:NADH-quinone oxidoreductase subunit L
MTLPLVLLAVFAVSAGWVGIPEEFPLIGGLLPNWFHDFVGGTLLEHPEAVTFSYIPLLTSLSSGVRWSLSGLGCISQG